MRRNARNLVEDHGRTEERRRQILDAAAEVIARRGYHRARTREIAEQAGVAEGTIYNYYANKRELLLALIERVVTDTMFQALAQVDTDDPRSWLVAIMQDWFDILDRNRGLIKAVAPEMITDEDLWQNYLRRVVMPVVIRFLPLVQRSVQAGHLRAFNPRLILPAVVGGAMAAFVFYEYMGFPMGKESSREEVIAELANLFLEGWWRDGRTVQDHAAAGQGGLAETSAG